MSIRDLANDTEVDQVKGFLQINTDSTVFTPSNDVSNFDAGFMFTADAPAYTDGNFVFSIQDSPDDSVWTDVPAEKLNDPSGIGVMTIAGAISDGDLLPRIGAFSTNQFVRLKVVATSVTLGANMSVLISKQPEIKPAATT